MRIIGCDYHPSWQQVCWMETATGETGSSTTLAITRWEKHCRGVLCLDNAFALIDGHPPGRVNAPASGAPGRERSFVCSNQLDHHAASDHRCRALQAGKRDVVFRT